jgi:hypothetical protein
MGWGWWEGEKGGFGASGNIPFEKGRLGKMHGGYLQSEEIRCVSLTVPLY